MLPDFSLAGKVALVTGSTRGIGRAIAEGFVAAGAKVWFHGRQREEGEALAQQYGGHFCPADLADPVAVRNLAAALSAAENHLDILVNNAGMEVLMPIETLDMAMFDHIWQVNTRAAVELTALLLPLLKQASSASLINLTSIHESMPFPTNSAYSMAKSALAMFTRTMALELGSSGIRVNNLAPGAVETDLNRDSLDRIGMDNFARRIPLRRVGAPEDIVGPALFLASDASRYVTGTTIFVDGGYLQNLLRF
jgi:NAD(P)-dependent dehydrogenase (short-subunit alcohol dehydrogenase family)